MRSYNIFILLILFLCVNRADAVNLNESSSAGSPDIPVSSISSVESVPSRPLQLALPETRKLEISYHHIRSIATRINRVNIPEPTHFLRGVDRGYRHRDYALQDTLLHRSSLLHYNELHDTSSKYLTDVLREVTSSRSYGHLSTDRNDNVFDHVEQGYQGYVNTDASPEPYKENMSVSSLVNNDYRSNDDSWTTTYSLHQPNPIVVEMNNDKLDSQIVMLSDQSEAVASDSSVYKSDKPNTFSAPAAMSQPDNEFLLSMPPEVQQLYLVNNYSGSEDVTEYNIIFRFIVYMYESMQSFASFISNIFS